MLMAYLKSLNVSLNWDKSGLKIRFGLGMRFGLWITGLGITVLGITGLVITCLGMRFGKVSLR